MDSNLGAVVDGSRDYWRYTDHITNVASRRVVEFDSEHTPCRIHFEELTHLRETVDDPIHDWPYGQIQDQIVAKAHEAGIPVQMVDPRGTSRECRRCGTVADASRDDSEFVCIDRGYQSTQT